jgi:undecaprenyl-diphosphatase
MLMVTGLILAVSYGFQKKARKTGSVGPISALVVGTAQGLAIIPGISRSGITIVSGIFMGLPRDEAARFSFLLSIPAILGALALQLDADAATQVGLLSLFAGFLASGLVGLWALKILMAMVRKGRLAYFAPYCLALGAAALVYAIAG